MSLILSDHIAVNDTLSGDLLDGFLVDDGRNEDPKAKIPAPMKVGEKIIKAAGGGSTSCGGHKENLVSWFHGFTFYLFVGARSLP